MSVNDPTPQIDHQFSALLDLEARAEWQELLIDATKLLECGFLKPHQLAMLKGLKASALKNLGHREEAYGELLDSITLHTTPLSALTWLEHAWEGKPNPHPVWLPITRELVLRSHGQVLLLTLMGVLGRLPLQGQRQQLLDQIEALDAFLLSSHSDLARQWHWLRRAAPGGGSGTWG